MQSGQELLEETSTICKEIAQGLSSQDGASQAWQDSVAEIVEKINGVGGSFFFKTIPSIPVTRTCRRDAAALLELRKAGDWARFGPSLEQLIKSAQDLIEKAGMKGTILT